MEYETISNKLTVINKRTGELIKDMLTLTYIEPYQYNFTLFRVPKEYIARPDLISIDQYGSDEYTDIICKLNGISNPYSLNEGMLLALPSAGMLPLFRFEGDTIEQDYQEDKTSQRPKPKAKNEKRKANEALVNDKRFRIDKERGVVIY